MAEHSVPLTAGGRTIRWPERIHWWLRHRKPMRPCRVHCGCDCAVLPCRHVEFGTHAGRCAHCGRA